MKEGVQPVLKIITNCSHSTSLMDVYLAGDGPIDLLGVEFTSS